MSQNEDRVLTANRFLPAAPSATSVERCSPAPAADGLKRGRTVSGVFLQAAAIEDLIRREALVEPPQWLNLLIATSAAALSGLAAVTFRNWQFAAAAFGAGLIWLFAALFAAQHFYVVPLIEPLVALLIGAIAGVLVRIVVVGDEQRFLRRAFGLYLAPAMVERIAAAGSLPTLGGEAREVTLFFSDLVGFSTISESMAPEAIVSLMNAYLTTMSDEIERAGGFVDKFVGDAIVAMFGAPIHSPRHAAEAVEAALACCDRLKSFNVGRPIRLRHRIGLNAGEALVGNVGSRNRLSYTALGDAVNLASRLEQANTYYGTRILASATVEACCPRRFLLAGNRYDSSARAIRAGDNIRTARPQGKRD